MMLKTITPPAAEPVTLAEIKAHCRVDGTAEDALLAALVTVAREHGEHVTGRSFVEQTLELTTEKFPEASGWIELPRPPFITVDSIKYVDPDGVERTLAGTAYQVLDASDFLPARVELALDQEWPETMETAGAVRIRYRAGWPVAAGVATTPETIKGWIKLKAGTLFENRESVFQGGVMAEMPRDFADGLLDRWRVYG